MLERQVGEVDVVRDLEGQVQLNSGEWDRPVRVERQRSAGRPPRTSGLRHEGVQRRLPKASPSSARSKHALAGAPADPGGLAAPEEHEAAHRMPSARSSSAGSATEQLPKPPNSERRTRATSAARFALAPAQAPSLSEKAFWGHVSEDRSSSPGKAQAARRLRKPCCPSPRDGVVQTRRGLEDESSSRQR